MTKALIPFLVWEFSSRDAIIDDQPFFDKAAAHLKYHHEIADNTIQFFVSKSGEMVIGIVGPESIAGWLENNGFSSCPEEVFSDAATKIKMGDGEEIFDRIINWWWHPEEELVYVTSEKQSHPITYGEWLEPTVKKIDEPDWIEKIPMRAVYKFCSEQGYDGNNPKEFTRKNWKIFFGQAINHLKFEGMVEILKWNEDNEYDKTILDYLIHTKLEEAINAW